MPDRAGCARIAARARRSRSNSGVFCDRAGRDALQERPGAREAGPMRSASSASVSSSATRAGAVERRPRRAARIRLATTTARGRSAFQAAFSEDRRSAPPRYRASLSARSSAPMDSRPTAGNKFEMRRSEQRHDCVAAKSDSQGVEHEVDRRDRRLRSQRQRIAGDVRDPCRAKRVAGEIQIRQRAFEDDRDAVQRPGRLRGEPPRHGNQLFLAIAMREPERCDVCGGLRADQHRPDARCRRVRGHPT